MIDINEAPDKTARTLAAFLIDCALEDPYIQNIYMAAKHLCEGGLGHMTYQTQYESGTTYWRSGSFNRSIPRIPCCPAKPRVLVVVTGGVAYVYTDGPVDVVMADYDLDGCTNKELEEYPRDREGQRVNIYFDGQEDKAHVGRYFRLCETGKDAPEEE